MKAKNVFQWITRALLLIVLAGNSLALPSQTVSAKPLSGPYNCSTSQSQILTGDCNALLSLYNSTSGVNWFDNTDWLLTNTPCSWYGVTCTGNRVTGLFLDSNNLDGSIPTSLGSLAMLTQLSLTDNYLTGSIPMQLGNLTNLTTLYLHSNYLDGPIPATLGNLNNLQELHLGSNALSGQIPAQLGNLSSLTMLVLGTNQLEGSIPAELGNLSNLTVLILGSNYLTGTIPSALGNLSNLTGLYLDTNSFTGPIPTELGNLTSLTGLHLSGNQLSGDFPTSITNLVNLTELEFDHCAGLTSPSQTVTDFIDNFLPGWPTECLPTITDVFPNHGSAAGGTSLTIDGENFYGTSAVTFGGTPASSFSIEDISEITATSPAHAAGPVSITITNLYGDGTATDAFTYRAPFTGCASPAQTQIPEAECAALVALYNATDGANWYINTDWLQTDTPCDWYGVNCYNETYVIGLSLGSNSLSGQIPADIGDLTQLETMHLEYNALTGSIPTDLGDLTSLETLDLSYNQFEGAIPAELGSLTSLTTLYLHGNQLSGEFPATIIQLVNLTDFGFDQCLGLISHDQNVIDFIDNLVGPYWMSDCQPYIIDVSPSHGPVSGGTTVTLDGGNFSTVSAVTFGGEDASFTIEGDWGMTVTTPAHVAGSVDIVITNLYGEDTSTDAFTYSLPFTDCASPNQTQIPETECAALLALYNGTDGANWLDNTDWLQINTPCDWHGVVCNGSNVVNLELQANNLSGELPAALADLTELEALYLDDNNLTGSIPTQLGSLTNLIWLYLPRNELTGSIPAELGNLYYLAGLDLSYNQLSGPLPSELGDMTNLQYLYLNNNHFSGEFPTSIVNLNYLYDFTFDCELTSSQAAVIAFVNAFDPAWKDKVCPRQIAPVGGAVLDNGRSDKLNDIIWDFRWSGVENATKYGLYVFQKQGSGPLINIVTVGNTAYHYVGRGIFISEATRQDWYWQVRAYIHGQWGTWSDARSFSVEPLNSDAPDLLSKNGGFNIYPGKSLIPTNWSAINFSALDGKAKTPKKEGAASVKIAGVLGKTKALSQTLVTSGWAGDIFVFSYWAKGSAIPKAGLCQAQVLFYNGSVLKATKTLNCPAGTTYNWKQAKLNFTAPVAYTKVVIKFIYSKPSGTIWLDALGLFR